MNFNESEFVELKEKINDEICKEIIAFANSKGGTLYIGVSDDGTVAGIDNMDKVILQLNNKIHDNIKPDVTMFVSYEPQTIENKEILAVTIQKGTDRPYYLASKGLKPSGVFVRNGSSSDPATDTAIRKMIKETDGDNFESMRSLNQSLTFEYASGQFTRHNISFDKSKMQTLGLISSDGTYSNAALLLSDQCNCTIKAATFSGSDKTDFQDRREFSGSLFKQMDELYSYLDLRNRTRAAFEGLYRTDTRDYPEEALRESLLNCLVHRNYSISASTLVSIYDDRIEFISIGGLPTDIGLDDIMLGISVCRNPKLAAIFYRLELIEAYGTGIPKIMNSYSKYSEKPKIEVSNNAFKLTLPNCNFGKDDNPGTVENESGNSSEDKIIEYIKVHGSIDRKNIEALLDISQSTASRLIQKLISDGKLYVEGKGKATCYKTK